MYIPLTPIRFLYRAVDLYGRKVGVVCGERRFTFAAFGERCERLAAGLRRLGVEAGDRVSYLTFNRAELLEGYYGVPLARAILMPLNVRLHWRELVEMVGEATPRVLLYEPEFRGVVERIRAACPTVRAVVGFGEEYEGWLAKERGERPDFDSFREDETAELFYTSGSTGRPKGVLLTHRTLYLHALGVAQMYNDRDAGVELMAVPLFHANGWGRPHTAVMNGVKQVLVRRFEAEGALRLIQEEGVTYLPLVPTMAQALLDCAERGRYETGSLRLITLGGAPSTPELIGRVEEAFGCWALSGYGLTETSPAIATVHQKSTVEYGDEGERRERQASGGWALVGSEIRVVDEAGADVARDRTAVGEVIVRSDSVMDGYFGDPEGTSAVLRGGWLHTGDLAVWDEESYVYVVDRAKDIIISGGENISSVEVEGAIGAHSGVAECAVVGAWDARWGEAPVAFVRLRTGVELTEAGLREFLRGRLAGFKLPREVRFVVDELPKSGSGKILKRELRGWLGTGPGEGADR